MKNLPIEKQVCTLEQAKKLAELLGDDAPGSLWSWQCITDPVLKTKTWVLVLSKTLHGLLVDALPAYTGDELWVMYCQVAQEGLPVYETTLDMRNEPERAVEIVARELINELEKKES